MPFSNGLYHLKTTVESSSASEAAKLDEVKAAVDAAKTANTERLTTVDSTVSSTSSAEVARLDQVKAAVDTAKAAIDSTSATEVARIDQVKAGIDALNTKLLGDKIIGHVSPTPARKVAEGKFYIGGATANLPGGLTSTARAIFQLENPASSTKVIYVVKATLYCDITQLIHYYEGATLDSPQLLSSATMNINRAAGSAASVALIRTATAFSGGVRWPNVSRITDQLNLDFPPLVLPPGRNLSIVGTSAATQTLVANIYYYEE